MKKKRLKQKFPLWEFKKLFCIMKLVFFFLLLSSNLVWAGQTYAQIASLNLNLNNVTLEEVFDAIRKQSEFEFFYNNDQVNTSLKVSVKAKNADIKTVLEQALPDIYEYAINDRYILVNKRKEVIPVSSSLLQQQQTKKTMTGKVTDAQGEPIIGANIVEKGTTNGTVTDVDGNFVLSVEENASIHISYIGYLAQDINTTGRTSFQITLQEDTQALDELVVVGYGVQKKTSVTAAVSTLDGEEIANIPTTNITNTIGGRLAGVIVKQGTGEPGKDGSNIYIRGISSTGATQPLVIIDGIPRSFVQFSQLDPNTVDSYTVLKDAAAVAPYGIAGANGVILVTTKRGKIGEPTFSYNGYVGFQNPTMLPKYVTNYEYALLRNEAAKNDGLPLPYSEHALQKFQDGTDPDAYPTDYVWDRIVNKNAVLTTHNIEVNGGTERITYYGSVGYQSQQGMWETTSNNRYNLSMNLDAKISNTTQLSLGIIGRVQRLIYPPSDYTHHGTGRIFELAGYAIPVYGPFQFSNGMYGNFIMSAIYGTGYYQYNSTTANAQLTLEQELPFIKGLSFRGTLAYDPTFVDTKTWRTPMQIATIDTSQDPYVITDGTFNDPKASLDQSYQRSQQFTYQAGLYYARVFGDHNINMIGVFETNRNSELSWGLGKRNYDLLIDEINMGSSNPQDWSTRGSSWEANQLGFVYRIAYDYLGKYMLETSGRYDGSYYFAPDERFGFFPAVSAGWRLSEESFLKDLTVLSNLKLRASYGEVGALAGSPFQYLSTYDVIGGNYVIGGNPVTGIRERIEPNPRITWERSRKTDIGLEIGLLNGMFNAEFDYFYEKRSNMLLNPNVIVPLEYGIGLSQVNSGIMDNRGVEFVISTNHDLKRDLRIGFSASFTYAKNKLIQVFETAATYDNLNRRQTGRALGTQFGYEAMGLFQLNDFDEEGNLRAGIATQPWGKVHPGDIRYRDMNADGQIDENDLTVIGDPVSSPRIMYGFSPSLSYKNLTVELLFQGAAKVNYYYHPSSVMPFWNGMHAYEHNFDHWTPDNPNASNPRLTSSPVSNNMQTSSFWIGNAAYLRLKTIDISYNIPESLLNYLNLSAVRVFVSGQNLLTWTDLMYDPELGGNDSYVPSSAWTYPQQKVISLGLNVTF